MLAAVDDSGVPAELEASGVWTQAGLEEQGNRQLRNRRGGGRGVHDGGGKCGNKVGTGGCKRRCDTAVKRFAVYTVPLVLITLRRSG